MSVFFRINFYKFLAHKNSGFFLALILHSFIALGLMFNFKPKIAPQQIIKINFLNTNSKVYKQNFSTNLNQNSKRKSSENSKNSSINQAETEPVYNAPELNNPSPIYPLQAKSRGITGKVVLEVLVSEDGKPLNVKIFSSSGSDLLDDSALETVSNWSFLPAKRFGNNVLAKIYVPIEFKLI